jgi:hypothetical protein
VSVNAPTAQAGEASASIRTRNNTSGVISGDEVQTVEDLGLGADGASPPAITGTGVRGWLRGIYEKIEAARALLAGTLTVSGPLTDAQLRAVAVPVTGTVTATGGLTDAQLRATAVPVTVSDGLGPLTVDGSVAVSNFPATQPISAAALPLPGGAATAANQNDALAALDNIFTRQGNGAQHTVVDSLPAVTGAVSVTNLPATQAVSGPLTDAQLRAVAVPVSGPLTDVQLRATAVPISDGGGSITVDAASLPLPTGAASSANQATTNASLASLDTKAPALGQAAMAASVPVAIASNQTAIAISASALPLPATASQEHVTAASPHAARLSDGAAFYDGAKTGQLPTTLGAKTGANSISVVQASDHLLALDATLLGGLLKAIARGGAKGTTSAADVTSESLDANRQALHVVDTYAPVAENNTVGAICVSRKPRADGLDVWTTGKALAAASVVLKASAGRLRMIYAANYNAAARYLHLFNATSLPVNGTAPDLLFLVAATNGERIVGAEFFGEDGFYFSTGMVAAMSTTRATLTLATAADHDFLFGLM